MKSSLKIVPTASMSKKIADEINEAIHNEEFNMIIKLINTEAQNGLYSYSGSGSLSLKTVDKLKELGYSVETGSHMNEDHYNIDWKKASDIIEIKETKIKNFYVNGDETMIKKSSFVNDLIRRYDNVCWGGVESKHWSMSSYNDVVVVYETGIRGPADWFYVNHEYKWAHGGYTGYHETYTDEEFEKMIKEIFERNKKYHD
jgi:hypothetical protein